MDINPSKAFLITSEGRVEEISPLNGKEFQLEEVQSRVEGYIEVVYLSDEQIVVVNENGKFDKEPNIVATEIARDNKALGYCDYIAGNAVVCPSRMLP